MAVQTEINIPSKFAHLAEYGEIVRRLTEAMLDYARTTANVVAYTGIPYMSKEFRELRFPDMMSFDRIRWQEYKTNNANWGQSPFALVPDLCAKVIEPKEKYFEVEDQIAHFLRDKVRLILLLNPRQKSILVYMANNITHLTSDDTLDGGDVLPGFSAPVQALFPE